MAFLMEAGVYMKCVICEHDFNSKYLGHQILIEGYFGIVCKHCEKVIKKLRKGKPHGKTGITEKK
jgi:DNA-directed RNA polymerase subunit RPC12/RpoP